MLYITIQSFLFTYQISTYFLLEFNQVISYSDGTSNNGTGKSGKGKNAAGNNGTNGKVGKNGTFPILGFGWEVETLRRGEV